jgi:hypothetical protein
MEILYFIISGFLSILLFSTIFNELNSGKLHLFDRIQNFTCKLKYRSIYYWIVNMSIIVYVSFVQHSGHINYIKIGIPLGMLFSLNEIIFNTGFSILKRRKI